MNDLSDINIPVTTMIDLDSLAYAVSRQPYSVIVGFIKRLDELCADWDVTMELHRYFVAELQKQGETLRDEMIEEDESDPKYEQLALFGEEEPVTSVRFSDARTGDHPPRQGEDLRG